MAGISANVNVNVNAQQLNNLEAKLNRVQGILNRINKDPISIDDGRASKAVKEIANQISNLASEQLKLNTINMSTIAGLKDKAAAYKLVAENAKVSGQLFKDATIASERLSRRAATADLERLKVLKEFYSTQVLVSRNKEPVRVNYGLEELARQQKIAFSANSIASLEAYRSQLEQIYELMSGNAPGRSQLLDMMTEADKRLKALQRPTQKAPELAKPAGPSTELGSPKEYIQRQKAADDLLAANRKLERISVNLDAAAISQNDKLQIRNRLEEAFNATQQQNFQLAQKLGAEADRYLRDAKSRQTSAEKIERQRLRVQELNAKAAEKTAAFIATAESNLAQGASPLEIWQQGLNRVEKTAGEILDLSKQLGKEFDKQLKNIPLPEKPLATLLGGGQEVAARAKYQSQINTGKEYGPATSKAEQQFQQNAATAAQKRVDLNNVFNRQALALKTLLSDFNTLENKGITFLEEKARLENLVAVVTQKRFDINQKNVDIIGNELKTLRAVKTFRTSEARAAGVLGGSTPKTGGKTEADMIESRRNRLLENALSLQGNLISIEGRGGQVAQEKLDLEAKILQLKKLQNKASQADLQIVAQQIQELRIKAKTISNQVPRQEKGASFLEEKFGAKGSKAISEGLVGGAFPLLFGQGLGASIGGGLGGAAGGFLGGGLGFGLSLAGTAIGAELDKAVIAAGELNTAFLTAAGSYSEIRKQGIQFTAELENQVNLLKESGNFGAATQLERSAVQGATGDINASATQGVAAAGSVLSATWNDTYKAIQTTLGVIGSPFLFALNALLTPVKALFQGFNAIASGVTYLIRLIPGVAGSIDSSNEKAYKLTKEYQDQIAEINKQINEASKLNNIQAEQVAYARQSLGLGKADTEILGKRAEAAKRVAENEKEIEKIRRENPTRTEEQRQKVNQLVSQQQRKFTLEESAIAFTKAQEIFLEIQDNNRQVAQQKKEYEQQYQDFVTDRAREQADLNLEAVRKIQDARLKGLEQEAKAAKEIADEQLRSSELASKQRSLSGSVQAAVSGDPVTGELLNNVQTAIDQWRNGRQAVENETADRQKQLQLEIQRGEVQIQRYKYDMAIKIARTNEDSQKKIARINEQINKQNEDISRRAYLRQLYSVGLPVSRELRKAEIDRSTAQQALSNPLGNLTPNDRQFYQNQLDYANQTLRALDPIMGQINTLLQGIDDNKLNVSKVPSMQNIPGLTAPSADVAKAEASVLKQLKTTEEYITQLKQTNGLKQEDITLAETIIGLNKQGLDQVNQLAISAKTELATKQESLNLLLTGVNPAIADQVAQLQVAASLEEKRLKNIIDILKAYKDPALQAALTPLIKDLQTILDAIPQKVSTARTAIEQSAQPIVGEKIISSYAQARQELEDLATWENVAVTGAESISDAFGNAFKEIASGTSSAQEVLAGFFQNLANSFSDMAAKMISDLVMLSLYNNIIGPLFGNSMGNSLFAPGPSGYTFPSLFGAADGAAFSNSIKPFAMGGIVSSPTLFKFADGGAMNTGVMGEAGPEAILPLSRGSDGKLGVSANGSSGNTNVTVNVDASGSKVQGDNTGANQLGRAVAAAVQDELLRQKRPGGLLS